jgi:hypothetical protein
MSLSHQYIVYKLNRRAEVERENARMDELEKAATPFFYAVFIVVALVTLWVATSEYRDVAQVKIDTLATKQENENMSAKLAACANGEAVLLYPGHWMPCNGVKRMEVKK